MRLSSVLIDLNAILSYRFPNALISLIVWISSYIVSFFLKQDQELIKKYFFSGILDFDDFLTLMTKKMTEKDETEDLQKAFWLFDEDGTGKISRANLDRVAIELGYDPDKMQDELQVYEWKKQQPVDDRLTCTGYNLFIKRTPIVLNFISLIESVIIYQI